METARSIVVWLALISLTACGSKSSLDELKVTQEKLCACTTSACLQEQSKALESFKSKFQTLSDQDLDTALQVTAKGLDCAATLAKTLSNQ